MASRLMTTRVQLLMQNRQRITAYMPNLRAAVRHFRAFSSYDERSSSDGDYITVDRVLDSNDIDLPDPRLGLLGPQDKRFPLPGMVGPSEKVHSPLGVFKVVPRSEPDVLTAQTSRDRHDTVLDQLNTAVKQIEEEEREGYMSEEQPSPADLLECVAQECPQLLRKDFQDLFPEHDLSHGSLTVITISQKTTNDMTGWSPHVEEEREELLDHFIAGADEICLALQEAGYWADFIDPSSGRPYLGAYTNATLFETDERYRQLGFEINDLGCCKVISHHLWGSNAYVGSLFTNAPLEHPVISEMVKQKKQS